MKHNNSVFLYGVNTVNLGDDLFFKIILERYPNTNFVFFAPEIYKTIFSNSKNCIVFSVKEDCNFPIIGKLINKLHTLIMLLYSFVKYRIDVFLIIGGSIFMQGNSNMPRLLKKLQFFKVLFPTLKICILGSNFGPFSSNDWLKRMKVLLKGVDDICFRDEYSYNLFSDLSNVRQANDIVMHTQDSLNVSKSKSICVNLRSIKQWKNLSVLHKEYLSTTKKIVDTYLDSGYNVKLISFCRHYGDEEIMDELYSMIRKKENITKIYYHGNIEESINAIRECEIIIASRFHAVVLGLLYRLKVIPISYSVKTENMLKSLEIWNKIYDYTNYCKSPIEELIDKAIDKFVVDETQNRQFDYLDNILSRK